MMKKCILIIWLLLMVSFEASATSQTDTKMELLRLLTQTKQGSTDRLNLLYQLVQATKANPQVRIYYINQLLKEAEAQQNSEFMCRAYLTRMFVAYNMYDVKAVNYWMGLLEPLARKEKLYDLMFQGKQCVVDFLMLSEEYELEEKEANKMLQEAMELKSDIGVITAYQCLANVYNMTYRPTEAIEILLKAYELAVKIKFHILALELNRALINSFEKKGDKRNRMKYVKIQEAYIERILKEEPEIRTTLDASMLSMYITSIEFYTDSGDYGRAEKYRRLAEEPNVSKHGTYAMNFHLACYHLYSATGNLEKALEEADALLKLFKNVSANTHNDMGFMKANILVQLGRYDKALTLYKFLNTEKDSIQVSILNKQVEQVRNSYNADSLLLEKRRINLYINLISTSIIAIVALIIIGLLLRSYRVRTSFRKSEQKMRNMAQEMEQMNQAKERFLSCISANISQPLNGVVEGSLRLISDNDLTDEERKKISDYITQTSDELLKLINNILDLSRLEAGMMKFSLSELELINFTNSFVTSLAANNGIKICTILPQSEIILIIDVTRLSELMTRLLSNANQKSEGIAFEVLLSTDGNSVECRASGTVLADTQPSQDTIIMNEINRLFVKHFNGSYHIEKGVCITFTFPLNTSPK